MQRRLYNNGDLQSMLNYLKANPKAKEAVINAIDASYNGKPDFTGDRAALMRCINIAFVDAFDRYDSDVAEQFITYTEKVFGENWHMNGITFPG